MHRLARKAGILLGETLPFWPSTVILLAGAAVSLAQRHYESVGVCLFMAAAFAGAALRFTATRAGVTRKARRELIAALPRISDDRPWLAREDHLVRTCRRSLPGFWSLMTIDEDQLPALAEGEPGPVTWTSYRISYAMPSIVRITDGVMARPGEDGEMEVDLPHRSRREVAAEARKLLRAMMRGHLAADAAEVAALLTSIRAAEPFRPPELEPTSA